MLGTIGSGNFADADNSMGKYGKVAIYDVLATGHFKILSKMAFWKQSPNTLYFFNSAFELERVLEN